MVLTAEDRKQLQATWAKVSPHLEDIGCDALTRLFFTFPQSKTYFSHFDLSPGSKDVRHHGLKVAKALDNALKHLDDVRGALAQLSDLHAYTLRVDPVNFKLLAKCFHVVLATHLRGEYNAVTYLAFDKFLYLVADMLAEKYR